MAQKNATPTHQQAEFIRRSGRDPLYYTVIRELPHSLIVIDRMTQTVEIVTKQ